MMTPGSKAWGPAPPPFPGHDLCVVNDANMESNRRAPLSYSMPDMKTLAGYVT